MGTNRARSIPFAGMGALLCLAALACSASAFCAPPTSARRAVAPLRSMDADADYEAPSDTSEFDGDDVVDVAQAADDLDALKRELLIKMSASARGQAKTAGGLNDEVEALASKLEASAAPMSLKDVTGRWSLSFCSTQLFRSSPFWMAGRATCADGKEAERYDWFCEQHRKATMVSEIGAVRQIITDDELVSEFETTVAAFPMRVGGAMPLNILGSIVSSASIGAATGGGEAGGALDLELLMGDVEVKGSNIPGLRTILDAGAKLDSRALNDALPIDTPRPVFSTTFVDDEIRVSRDGDRNLYVYVKESADPYLTTYDDVAADLGIPELVTGVLGALSSS